MKYCDIIVNTCGIVSAGLFLFFPCGYCICFVRLVSMGSSKKAVVYTR